MSTKKNYATDQESFWAGEFGNRYIDRNKDSQLLASNISLFSQIISCLPGVESVFEVGANIGMNLRAIRKLLPEATLSAVEINEKAYRELEELKEVRAQLGSILDVEIDAQSDFVFTKGVLIHIAPEKLDEVYEKIVAASRRYVCVIEYYNPVPDEIPYRGHEGKLFKRDFAGEILDAHDDLELVDYGFVYHRDPVFPQDDLTWFLLER